MTSFEDLVEKLKRGDFTELAPLFAESESGAPSAVSAWLREGRFDSEPAALHEALSCACFNGMIPAARELLEHGADPAAGAGSGMDALHWAVNRGQLATVQLLLTSGARLDTISSHSTTVLETAKWSVEHEPKPDHAKIIEVLEKAGAR